MSEKLSEEVGESEESAENPPSVHGVAHFTSIKARYREIKAELSDLSAHLVPKKQETFQREIHDLLVQISQRHEGSNFKMAYDLSTIEVLPPRWDRMSALLYALSILTTTGYSYAVPTTWKGQCVGIGYGMIGIPLMVLAAVDIGRFLSRIVLKVYTQYCEFSSRLCGRKKKEILDLVNHSNPILRVRRHRSFLKEYSNCDGKESDRETDTGEEHLNNNDPEEVNEEAKKPSEVPKTKRLPLSLNASILLLFCTLGGLMMMAAGSNKTFLEAFFVTFNLVANLTMSEMPTDLNHVLTLIYIFIFVTFGVAVLSMCAELAAFELKDLFLKIHYFGRKINFKRKKRPEQMEVEVKELLKIIEEIRRRYPEKEHITHLDILQYMNEQSMAGSTPLDRRDTIAFMPQTVETLKFADEGEPEDRSLSRVEELPLLDKSVDLWAFFSESELEERLRQHSVQHQKRILGRLQRQKRQSTINSLHFPNDECINLLCEANNE
ncbi:unnamed protein product, partial [Mesorhabditis belari]|uniref:Potassium channel domain-containing protein n=1 Tax=Mesorhabditis belari TaxID=2138241 RepID=A0AAF3F5F4_9BILA